jgi:hypothetical protein
MNNHLQPKYFELCKKLVEEGKVFSILVPIEGTPESGPYAVRMRGVRGLGFKLMLFENGYVALFSNSKEKNIYGMPAIWKDIYHSAFGNDNLDPVRRAIMEGLRERIQKEAV